MDSQPPIVNPRVPFQGYILGGLSGGRMVIIQGNIQPQAKSFTVALVCSGGDVALQLNPRFSKPFLGCTLGYTARKGGLWGSEERCNLPNFRPGGVLEIIIRTQEHGYQVSVNGQHALEFLHRLPLASVQALEVTGDVTLTCITFTGSMSRPQPQPGVLGTLPHTPMTISNPGVPFHMALSKDPMGLIHPITIVGTVNPNANRFHANLWNSTSGDVVLHVNPRLGEAVLVRNTQQRGTWGPEERHLAEAMPFKRGQPFQLEIHPLSQAFTVWVNGRHVCDYAHRLPPSTIDRLEVTGDVTLACIKH